MSKAVAYVAEQEKNASVTVIDVEDVGTACRGCGSKGVVYSVHCWREEKRPVIALCKPCAEKRAGGAGRVAIRGDRMGLVAGWQKGERALLTEDQARQRREAAAARRERPNDRLAASGSAGGSEPLPSYKGS